MRQSCLIVILEGLYWGFTPLISAIARMMLFVYGHFKVAFFNITFFWNTLLLYLGTIDSFAAVPKIYSCRYENLKLMFIKNFSSK